MSSTICDGPQRVKILSLNIRSLFANFNEVLVNFTEFDIICFCETWLNDSIKDQMISIDGFETFRLDQGKGNIVNKSGKPKRGGGLIIYVKKGLSEYTTLLEDVSLVTKEIEHLWISIDKPNVKRQILSNVYRPPEAKLTEGLKSLNNSVEALKFSNNSELTIQGDFNVNYNLRNTPVF